MKSNPVVFPFKPFSGLQGKTLRNNFAGDLQFTLPDVQRLLRRNLLRSVRLRGSTTAEKIFSLFLHPEVRFGPKRFLTAHEKFWLDKLNYFIGRNKPITFSILSFPGKAPVPLKTNRTLPDLGELLALRRLRDIALKIKEVYPRGARIYIITEGILGRYIGIPSIEARAYEQELERWTRRLKWKSVLRFIPLGELKKVPRFATLLQKERIRFKRAFRHNDPETMKKYALAYPSIFHLINTRRIALPILAQLYTNPSLDPRLRVLKLHIERKAQRALWNYFAILAVRDKVRFLEKKAPHALALSVSPKPCRLGINLLERKNELLPHHGVVVGTTMRYLVELYTAPEKYVRVYLKGDRERKPFFYLPASRTSGRWRIK